MIDGIIKADGTSRLIRAELPATYEEFRAQCHAGAQPLDVLFNSIGWSQLPTFLNKANLLNDEIASVFGMDVAAVPNDVFAFLGKYNQYWWSVLHGQAGQGYSEAKTNITDVLEITYVSSGTVDLPYSSKIEINQETGAISLVNPQTITIHGGRTTTTAWADVQALSKLAPVYIQGIYTDPTGIYYLPIGSTAGSANADTKTIHYVYDQDDDAWLRMSNNGLPVAQKVTSQIYNIPAGETTYVHSTNRNAYPDSGTVDGLTYQYLGIPFQNAVTAPKIATGSYTGTDTYGESNPNSLTFDFEPKIVIFMPVTTGFGAVMAPDSRYAKFIGSESGSYCRPTFNGTVLTWYSTKDKYYQLNSSGESYNYIAIG